MPRLRTPPRVAHPATRRSTRRLTGLFRTLASAPLAAWLAATPLIAFGALAPSDAWAQPPSRSARPWLGVVLDPGDGSEGVPVTQVVQGSPAHKANIAVGDRITALNAQTVRTPREVIDTVKSMSPGQGLRVTLLRAGKKLQAQTTLTAMPTSEELLRAQHSGKRVPELVGARPIAGNPSARSMASLRGRVVLVEFWSPYCVACRLSSPHLNAWSKQYGARGLTVLGVGGSDEPDALATSAREWGLEYPLVADTDMGTWKAWGIRDAPSMLLIDKKGVVRDVAIGFDMLRFRELQAHIERLLLEN